VTSASGGTSRPNDCRKDILPYAWPGATFTVLEAGREILVEQRALSLSTGVGSTTREKVESIYGNFHRRRQVPDTRWL